MDIASVVKIGSQTIKIKYSHLKKVFKLSLEILLMNWPYLLAFWICAYLVVSIYNRYSDDYVQPYTLVFARQVNFQGNFETVRQWNELLYETLNTKYQKRDFLSSDSKFSFSKGTYSIECLYSFSKIKDTIIQKEFMQDIYKFSNHLPYGLHIKIRKNPVSTQKIPTYYSGIAPLIVLIVLVLWAFFTTRLRLFTFLDNEDTEIDYIAIIPFCPHDGQIPILNDGRKFASSFSFLFNRIIPTNDFSIGQTILITSTVANEGKTTVSLNFALTATRNGLKTVIVDSDLRMGKLSAALKRLWNKDYETKGLSAYFFGENPQKTDEYITRFENYPDIVWSGYLIPERANELLRSTKYNELIADLRKNYDLIIIDTAPAYLCPEAIYLSRIVDSVIFVVRDKYTPLNLTKEIFTELKNINPQTAMVVNDAMWRGGEFGYYDY